MMQNIKKASQLKITTVMKNMEKRGFQSHYCETKEDAAKMALSLIQDNQLVSWGGSATINQLGIKDALKERTVTIIDPYATNDLLESTERKRQSLLADVFLMSSNAVTMEGELVNIDGTSNRVAALCFGPRKVIVIIGSNKIVATREDALSRAEESAAIPNAVRLNRNTPCTVTGFCSHCLSKDCICCNVVMTRYCSTPGRIEVIFVNDSLGF